MGYESQDNVVEEVTQMGIKVRDFAYESTLPPISSVPQFVGGPRPLKRERTHEDGGDSPSLPHSPSHARGGHFAVLKKAKGLARELTEGFVLAPVARRSRFRARSTRRRVVRCWEVLRSENGARNEGGDIDIVLRLARGRLRGPHQRL